MQLIWKVTDKVFYTYQLSWFNAIRSCWQLSFMCSAHKGDVTDCATSSLMMSFKKCNVMYTWYRYMLGDRQHLSGQRATTQLIWEVTNKVFYTYQLSWFDVIWSCWQLSFMCSANKGDNLWSLLSLGPFSCTIVLRNVGLCYFSAGSGRGVFRIRNKVSWFSNIRIWHWKCRRVGCTYARL